MAEITNEDRHDNVSADSHARQQNIIQRERATRVEGSYGDSTSLSQLIAGMKENTVMYDQVVGINHSNKGAYLLLYRNDIEIRIPFELSSDNLPEELLNDLSPSHINRQCMMLRKFTNVTIPYVPLRPMNDENGQYILGSIVKALSILRYNDIIRKNLVREGEPVDVMILSVARHAMYGIAHGVEIRMAKRDIAVNYCDDMRTMYKPGQTITCKVTAINILKNNGVFDNRIEMTVSGRQWAIEEAIRKHRKKLTPGAEFAGTITGIKESSSGSRDPRPTYYITLNGLNYPASCRDVYSGLNLPAGTMLEPGDVVWTRIVRFDKNDMAIVKIVQVVKYI